MPKADGCYEVYKTMNPPWDGLWMLPDETLAELISAYGAIVSILRGMKSRNFIDVAETHMYFLREQERRRRARAGEWTWGQRYGWSDADFLPEKVSERV